MVERALWQSRFVVPAAVVELFLAELEDAAASIAAFEEPGPADAMDQSWRIELIHETEPDAGALAGRLAPLAARAGLGAIDVTVAPLPATDWLTRVAESFAPERIGRFWIHGSHVETPPPAGSVPIEIDAGLAFGSGEHATTQGCLLAIDRLARRRRLRRILDLGCGSGILAIAAAKCWPARVLAADNDPRAVEVARDNAARNRVAQQVRGVVSEGYAHRAIRARAPFDLIVANILADPLCELADDTARHLAPGGIVVLSGMFDRQAPRVIAVHQRSGLRRRRRVDLGIWSTVIMRRA